jgi:hypothetical protein
MKAPNSSLSVSFHVFFLPRILIKPSFDSLLGVTIGFSHYDRHHVLGHQKFEILLNCLQAGRRSSYPMALSHNVRLG